MTEARTGWTSPTAGILPDALPDFPWKKEGAAAVTIVDGAFVLDDNNPADLLAYSRPLHPDDTTITNHRPNSSAWVQARLRVVQADPWAPKTSAPVCGIELSDGNRRIMAAVGNGAAMLIDPEHALILAKGHRFASSAYFDLMLAKIGSERWELWIDGVRVAVVPYLLARKVAGGAGGYSRWGSISNLHTSETHWQFVEDSLDEPPPAQITLARVMRSLPIAIQSRMGEIGTALLRATVGMLAHPAHGLQETAQGLTVGRWPIGGTWGYLGDTLPASLVPAWTALDPAGVSIDRERVRIHAQAAPTHTGSRADFPPFLSNAVPFAPDDDGTEYTVSSTWRVIKYAPDAAGRVGPHLQIWNGSRIVTAQLVEIDPLDPDLGHGWTLARAPTVGALTLVPSSLGIWRVDPMQAHRVELQVLGHEVVLLIVNGRIVDRARYGDFTDATNETHAFVAAGGAGAAGPEVYAYTWDAHAQRRMADLSTRPWWAQDALDRLVFLGGCERNDEADTAKRTWHMGSHGRGTATGLIVELRRLSCDFRPILLDYSEPAEWFLEASYPEVTPIYLEADGFFALMVAEVYQLPPNFTVETFGALAERYLLPLGTLDLRYELALAVLTTGAITNPDPSTSRVPVTSSEWFTIGAVVTIRTADNLTWELAVVKGVPTGTDVDLNLLGSSYPGSSVLRVTIART